MRAKNSLSLLFSLAYRFLAATVFRPGGARQAFPCFDEPHLRAPFRISVFRDRFHIGLSNSIVHATDDVGFYMGTGLVSTTSFMFQCIRKMHRHKKNTHTHT